MSDLPSYDYSDKEKEDDLKVTRENATDIANYINSLS